MASRKQINLSIALAHAKAGIPVFPALISSNKKTGKWDKQPAIKKWRENATTDPIQIQRWFDLSPKAVAGIELGRAGLMVIDADRHGGPDGVVNFYDLQVKHGGLPEGPVTNTAGGGQHFFFMQPNGEPFGNSTGNLPPGVDVRGKGGWVVAPGSVRPDGARWEEMPGIASLVEAFKEGTVPTLPVWLGATIRMAKSKPPPSTNGAHPAVATVATIATGREAVYARQALRGAAKDLADAPDGSRNETLNAKTFRMARMAARGWIAQSDVVDALHEAAKESGLDDAEIQKSLASGMTAGLDNPADDLEDLHPLIVDGVAFPAKAPNGKADDAEDPHPLTRKLPDPPEFPLDALPDILKGGIKTLEARTQAPTALCANSLLSAIVLATQAHRNVMLPTDQDRPISNFFVTVAETGERKTSVDNYALVPVKARQEARQIALESELRIYCDEHDAYAAERAVILKNNKRDYKAKAKALAALDEPKKPLGALMTCSDPTMEGLTKVLIDNQPSIGIFSSEGGGFFGGHGFSEDAKMRTAAALSKVWDDGCLDRVRAKDGYHNLRGRRVTTHLQIQPVIAATVFSDPLLTGQGLTSRLLPAAPKSTQGTRFWKDVSEEDKAGLVACHLRLTELFQTKLPIKEGTLNQLDPGLLKFDRHARKLWIKYTDDVERRLVPDGDLRPVSGFGAKMGEHVARLAGALCLFENSEAKLITAADIECATKLVDFYAETQLLLHGTSKVNAELLEVEKLLDWLMQKWQPKHRDHISLTDLMQAGPRFIRDSQKARRLMSILVDHRYVDVVKETVVIRGQKRRGSWKLRFHIWSAAPATPATPATVSTDEQ